MRSNNCVFKCVFVYILLWHDRSNAAVQVQDDGCLTPSGARGTCVPIDQCTPLIIFRSDVSNLPADYVKEELSKHVCDEGDNTRVCCLSNAVVNDEKIVPDIVDLDNKTLDDKEKNESGDVDVHNQSTEKIKPDDTNVNDSKLLENPPPPPDVTNHKNLNLLTEDCGYAKSPDKIINGINAKLNEFPWMALLSYRTNSGPKFKCGGTILNENYILTAAHCLVNTIYPLIGVRVGEYDVSKKEDCEIQQNGKKKCAPPVQDLAILEKIPHPEYNAAHFWNDIALVRVTKINLSLASTRPVCLPIPEESRDAEYTKVVVSGWGRVNDTHPSSDILQRVSLDVVNLTLCQNSYRTDPTVQLNYKYICAGGKYERDSCTGDSGGPLQVPSFLNDDVRFVQHGVLSFGHRECGLPGYPGLYTKLVYFMDWVLDNIKP